MQIMIPYLLSMTKTQEAEKTLVQSIQDKYGIGTLNIEDGTFTPNT